VVLVSLQTLSTLIDTVRAVRALSTDQTKIRLDVGERCVVNDSTQRKLLMPIHTGPCMQAAGRVDLGLIGHKDQVDPLTLGQ